MGLVEAWQNRSLATIYPSIYRDAIHRKLRRAGKVMHTAIYVVLGVDREGQRDVLSHWGIHQVRHSLSYVTLKDRKAFVADLKAIDQAPTSRWR